MLIATASQLHFRIHHYEGSGKPEGPEIIVHISFWFMHNTFISWWKHPFYTEKHKLC